MSSTLISVERSATLRNTDKRITKAFNTPVLPFRVNAASMAAEVVSFHWSMAPVDFPNQMYAGAIDLNTIKRDIMAMDRPRLEEEELEDQEAFMALSIEVISDLLDDEPDIYTSDDAKVRFR